jgi:hypothetical protein
LFKKLFKSEKEPPPDPAGTIEDLIVLERYPEAVDRLKARLKAHPDDLHAHLRLAEAYTGLKDRGRAMSEYVFVAEEYARDGFYDKGLALLSKARRLAPLDETLSDKIERLQLAKASERTRMLVVEGMREGGTGGSTTALLVERLWHHVVSSPLARNIPPEILKRMMSAMELASFPAGSTLATASEEGDRLLFLLDGVVRAHLPGTSGDAGLVRDFGPGDVIGESVLLERRPWPADYRTEEGAKALALDRAGLEKTLVGNPDPRGFLTALRMQHNDKGVVRTVHEMSGGAPSSPEGDPKS